MSTKVAFTLHFQTGWFHDLCRAVLYPKIEYPMNDSRRDELGVRWWEELTDSPMAVDESDPDSDRMATLTLRSADELVEFFRRVNAYRCPPTTTYVREDRSPLTMGALGLSLHVGVEGEGMRSRANLEARHRGEYACYGQIGAAPSAIDERKKKALDAARAALAELETIG